MPCRPLKSFPLFPKPTVPREESPAARTWLLVLVLQLLLLDLVLVRIQIQVPVLVVLPLAPVCCQWPGATENTFAYEFFKMFFALTSFTGQSGYEKFAVQTKLPFATGGGRKTRSPALAFLSLYFFFHSLFLFFVL